MSLSAEQAAAIAAAAAAHDKPESASQPKIITRKPEDVQAQSSGDSDKVKNLREQLQLMSVQFASLKTENAHLSQYKAGLQSLQINSRHTVHQLQVENQRLAREHRDAINELQLAKSRYANSDSKRWRVEEESRQNMQSLYAENEALKQKMKENQAYTDQFLQSAMKDGRWNPLPDDNLKDQVERLYGDVRHWAKSWANEAFTVASIPTDKAAEYGTFFAQFVACKSDGTLPDTLANPSSKMKSKIPALLLTAALTHRLEVEFFANPFFCVEPSQASVLRKVYEDLQKANFQQAHLWRYTLWRVLNPPATPNMPESEKAVARETHRRNRTLCETVNAEFVSGPANILIRAATEAGQTERTESLRSILHSAVEITTSLWTQRSYLRCVGMKVIHEHSIPFDVGSGMLTAHPLNKVDTEDHRNNDRDILVVARPALLAFDDDDVLGMQGDRSRVLGRAIVFLDEAIKKGGIFRRGTS